MALELETLGPTIEAVVETVGRDAITREWGIRLRSGTGSFFVPTTMAMAFELAPLLGRTINLIIHPIDRAGPSR